jgi:uncharacterized protein (DUF849 family)
VALIKACLNGGRTPAEHPAVPVTAEELAAAALAAASAGAGAVHVHPRRADGSETLEPGPCAEAVLAIRAAHPGLPVGLSTGAWMAPELERRLDLIGRWDPTPDFASVNFSEEGAAAVCRVLLDRNVGVEAGLASVKDAELLLASGLAGTCLRVLVEVEQPGGAEALAEAAAIDRVLDRGFASQRVHHGIGLATWDVIRRALDLGHSIRVGLEDTLVLPDGRPARDNADLVAQAVALAHDPSRHR